MVKTGLISDVLTTLNLEPGVDPVAVAITLPTRPVAPACPRIAEIVYLLCWE
jgi:hypothetical protein